MTPPPPADAAAWLARGEALEAAATPDSLGDAVRSYDCAIALLRPLAAASRGPAEAQLTPRRDLAIAFLHRGNALQKLATPEALAEAVRTYDEAVTLLSAPDLAALVPALQLLAATWLNRAHALHRQATPPAISAAVESHRHSVAVLENLAAATAITAEDALNRRVNLAAGCMHLANAHLDDSAARDHHLQARATALRSLQLLEPENLPTAHPAIAEIALLSHRALCDAVGQLFYATDDEELLRGLTEEASDSVDDALALARHWEQQRVQNLRPIAARIYHFGAQFYRLKQPHFLAEFLLEHLDPAQTPGAVPDDPMLYAIAEEAVAYAQQALQTTRVFDATQPAAVRQLETSRDLKAVASRLAELRTQHLPAHAQDGHA